jgi:hypothetical protein
MNAGMERVMNSKNLGARIMGNRVLDQKIWDFEVLGGKTVFSGGSGAILEFLEWLDSLGPKDRGSHEIWVNFQGF